MSDMLKAGKGELLLLTRLLQEELGRLPRAIVRCDFNKTSLLILMPL